MTDYYPCEICDAQTSADNGHVCDQCYGDVMEAFEVYVNESQISTTDNDS